MSRHDTEERPPLKAGDRIDDRYVVRGELGRGGLGVVYEAVQQSTKQRVAVKVIQPAHVTTKRSSARARFLRETRLVAQLSHPNIVRLIDAGELGELQLYAVFELVEGEQLAHYVRQEGRLAPAEAVRLMTQVLEALGAAHERGVVHRDLKPQNIVVTTTGLRRSAVVLDFGIATVVGEVRGEDFESLTQQGSAPGTPWYMAPEQFHGETSPSIDLYAWGLVLLECLMGHRAVPGQTPFEAMFWQAKETPVELPRWIAEHPLGAIIRRAVSKPVKTRYADAATLLHDLEECSLEGLDPPPLPARRLPTPEEIAPTVAPSAARVSEDAPPRLSPPRAVGAALAPDTRVESARSRLSMSGDDPLTLGNESGEFAIDLASEREMSLSEARPRERRTDDPRSRERSNGGAPLIALGVIVAIAAVVWVGFAMVPDESGEDAERQAMAPTPAVSPDPLTPARGDIGGAAVSDVGAATVDLGSLDSGRPGPGDTIVRGEPAGAMFENTAARKAFENDVGLLCDDARAVLTELDDASRAKPDCAGLGRALVGSLAQHEGTLQALDALDDEGRDAIAGAARHCKAAARGVLPLVMRCGAQGVIDAKLAQDRLLSPSVRWLFLDALPEDVAEVSEAYRRGDASMLPVGRVRKDVERLCVALDVHVSAADVGCVETGPVLGAIVDRHAPLLTYLGTLDEGSLQAIAPGFEACSAWAFSRLPEAIARCRHQESTRALDVLRGAAFFALRDRLLRSTQEKTPPTKKTPPVPKTPPDTASSGSPVGGGEPVNPLMNPGGGSSGASPPGNDGGTLAPDDDGEDGLEPPDSLPIDGEDAPPESLPVEDEDATP